MTKAPQKHNQLCRHWGFTGILVIIAALFTSWQSYRFGYNFPVTNMPLQQLTIWLVGLGVLFLLLPSFIKQTINNLEATRPSQKPYNQYKLLLFILVIGLAARLILFYSTPIMEDDYQRYLWDGAVTAHGYNPFSVNPSAVFNGQSHDPHLESLALQSGKVLGRINNNHLRTIYPPIAQAAFTIAYFIEPWSLNAWRFIVLLSEGCAVFFMLKLLKITQRPPLWIALYWWNPLIMKELINSAHMEALLLPFVFGALYFAHNKKLIWASIFILIATAIKIWPALLLPLLLRPLLPDKIQLGRPADWQKFLGIHFVFLVGLAVLMSPVFMAGLDADSGFVVYIAKWQSNSAFSPVFTDFWQTILTPFNIDTKTATLVSKLVLTLIIGIGALMLALKPIHGAKDLLWRSFLTALLMFLLSPAQFPWYGLWVLPFTIFFPLTAIMILTALLPIYYYGFYLNSRLNHDLFSNLIVWLIWIPVWGALLWEARKPLRALSLKIMQKLRVK